MTRYIGQCANCGSDQHPKGNVFRIMDKWYFEAGYPHDNVSHITTERVKVCNNCNHAHPFQRRTSARQRKLQEIAKQLLEN